MDQGYFARPSTYRHIHKLGQPGTWIVYVGLGATIDRTDVSWEELVRAVIQKNVDESVTPADVNSWIEAHGPQRAATTAEALLQHKKGRGWLRALRNDIHDVLYGDRVLMAGKLLGSLTLWAYAISIRGGSVLFITPNYDDYLVRELKGLQDLGITVNPVQVMPERNPESYQLPDNWRNAGTITCLHIHGFVPQGLSKARGVPALGEVTYQSTSTHTAKLMTGAFAKSNLLIIGSSVTDAPLVEALVGTKRCRKSRYAILPLQGSPWRDDKAVRTVNLGMERLNLERLEALGLEAVTPDTFGQVSQLLYEAAEVSQLDLNPNELEQSASPLRYDGRVGRWWKAWNSHVTRNSRQHFHHRLLAAVLPHVKDDMGATDAEGVKIEVWARWKPTTDRELALWASSVGSWRDSRLIRTGQITLDSEYMAVRVFCSGSPQLFFETDKNSRWRSYFGFPVWDSWGTVPFISGVVIIASMWPERGKADLGLAQSDGGGSINWKNLQALQWAAYRLDEVADVILGVKVRRTVEEKVIDIVSSPNPSDSDADFLLSFPRHTDQ